jgi:type VI secretion system secreted protein VgrG
LYLPPDCARQVIQLTARDEKRHNFALNSVRANHLEIELPGVHSDVGGGYLPLGRERLSLLKIHRVNVAKPKPLEETMEWHSAARELERLRATGLADHGNIQIQSVEVPPLARGKQEVIYRDYLLTICLERPVRGELALIALRVMRQLAINHGVPFDVIDDQDKTLKLPEELQSISARILEMALARQPILLDSEQERLLVSRYIHLSAHWTPTAGLLLNKPAQRNVRVIHPHQPQKGYPQ